MLSTILFPKKVLTGVFGSDAKIEVAIDGNKVKMEIDDKYDLFGNITFISTEADTSIKDQNPSIYLRSIPRSIREEYYTPLDESLTEVRTMLGLSKRIFYAWEGQNISI